MKAFAFFAAVCFSLVAGFAQSTAPDPKSVIISNLDQIERLYVTSLTGADRNEAIRLMNETRSLIAGMPIEAFGIKSPLRGNLLNEDGFASLYAQVGAESSDKSKTTIIESIGKTGMITSAQVGKLISLYNFDTYKEELLRGIAYNIIDPVNIGEALKYFDSAISKDRMAEFFKSLYQ